MNREEYRSGLWITQSKKGITYFKGKLKIGDKEYQLSLFNNDKKGNEKAPDFNLIIRDNVISQEKEKQSENGYKNTELGHNKVSDEQIYADFGNQLEIDDNDLAF